MSDLRVMAALSAACAMLHAGAAFAAPDAPRPQDVGPCAEMWERPVALREGVTMRAYALDEPRTMKAYVVKVDLTTPGIGFTATERDPRRGETMTDYTNEVWRIDTKRETTADFMSRRRAEGRNVEIAVNTSGWRPWGGKEACNSTYAELYRWVLADGVELSHDKKPGMGAYFIVRKDGSAEIRSVIRPSMTNDMVFAVYGNRHVLKDGERTPDADPAKRPDIHPRTAFGLTADKKTLVLLAVDGRQDGYSIGATCADVADILKREGCTDAVNMDGGGSTSLVVWDRKDGRPLMLNHHANGYVRKTALNLGITFPGARAREALFPLGAIRLTGGPLCAQQEQNRKYLLRLDPDRLLSRFRSEAGLEPKAEPYNGWESPKLRLDLAGHILGFYMAGAAMTVEATGDEELRRRLLYIVGELETVQNAHGDGYALAVKDGRKVFAEIAAGKIDVKINPKTEYGAFINGRFEPIYTMNKILLGLWRIHLATDSGRAKRVFLRLSDWFGDSIVEKLDDAQLQKVLDCEHGSLPETFTYAFQMTGDEKYRRWARRLCHERMLAPLAEGNAAHLCFHHANNEIPKFTGFERVYRITGEERLHRAIVNAWNAFVHDHAWANGGNSHREHLFPKEEFERKLFMDGGPESCNSVNMLRQTEALFETEPSADKVDFYERVLFDHLLSTHDPILGRTIYYTPPKPGASRTYSDEFESMWCCTGTGFEAPGKYGQMVFTHAPDESAVAVQLFAPATLDWKARGVKLRQETAFPYGETSCIKIEEVGKDAKFTVKVRRPSWAGDGFSVYVNGETVTDGRVVRPARPRAHGTRAPAYIPLTREWKAGDRIDIEFPMSVHAERLPGSKKYVAFFYGPTLLVGDLGSEGLKQSDYIAHPPASNSSSWKLGRPLPMPQLPASLPGDCESCLGRASDDFGKFLERTAGGAVQFRLKGSDILLKPIYDLHFSRYTMYWRLPDPAEEKAFAEARAKEAALAKRAADSVTIGDAASEKAHGFAGEKTDSGTGLYGEHHEYRWRHAASGGFFAFRLAVGDAPAGRRVLVAKYLARERGRRAFDVLVDGKCIYTENLVDNGRPGFVFTEMPVPAELLAGKKSVEVRFVPKAGNTAGGIFGLWLVDDGTGKKE